jgi:hypothetical protein
LPFEGNHDDANQALRVGDAALPAADVRDGRCHGYLLQKLTPPKIPVRFTWAEHRNPHLHEPASADF